MAIHFREISLVEKIYLKIIIYRNQTEMLRKPAKMDKRSQIFKLLLAVTPLIREKLSWIPGNGRCIKLWEDSIMGVKFF